MVVQVDRKAFLLHPPFEGLIDLGSRIVKITSNGDFIHVKCADGHTRVLDENAHVVGVILNEDGNDFDGPMPTA